MIMLISKIGSLIHNIIGLGRVTNKGPMRGDNDLSQGTYQNNKHNHLKEIRD